MKEDIYPSWENALEQDYTDVLFQTLDERRKIGSNHSYIASFTGQQGSSKSYSSLFLCGYLDPNFNIDKIFFDINELVNNKSKLKSHMAVLVDEQTRAFGVDSMRISSVIMSLKEQLRKRAIHMFYCSPTLKEEYHSSMYVFETMFIDKEYKESYCAYMTNELMCLGYVVIPHPLKSISKSLLDAYEKKKDEHLDALTDKPVDDIEDRCKLICKNKYFQQAEKVYVDRKGYVPSKMVVQVISKLYPEFKGSVIVYELADRIKLNKEVNGEWESPR